MPEDLDREYSSHKQSFDRLESHVRGFLDEIPLMAMAVRLDDSVEYVNRRWKEYTGQSLEGSTDWKWTEAIHPEDNIAFIDNWKVTLRTGDNFSSELRIRRFDGVYFWHSLKSWPAREIDGSIIRRFVTATDVDAQRRISNTLQDTNNELNQFAAIAAHDLQEPLRMVGSFITLLQRRYSGQLNEQAREYITKAIEANERMRILIADLLEFSRAGHESVQNQEVDANEVLAEVEAILKKSAGDTVFEIVHGQLPIVFINRSHLVSILQNLIGNGLKYSRPGIIPKVQVNAVNSNNEWVFSVRDNGIGIQTCDYNRIFDPFTRLHSRSEYSGTGIGLTICRKIITYYKGYIWVESSIGGGSTFNFSIPNRVSVNRNTETNSADPLILKSHV